MQKIIQETITMLPQDHISPDPETESKKTSSLDDDQKEPTNKIESEESALKPTVGAAAGRDHSTCTFVPTKRDVTVEETSSSSLRERLKRHRVEVAGRVWIPEMWGQENMLKDWIDCAAFDSSIVNSSVMSARASLIGEGRRESSNRFRIENSC